VVLECSRSPGDIKERVFIIFEVKVGHLELPVFRCLRLRGISRNGLNSVRVQGRILKERVVTMFKVKVRTLKKNKFSLFDAELALLRHLNVARRVMHF
jgi:hypothetical protein